MQPQPPLLQSVIQGANEHLTSTIYHPIPTQRSLRTLKNTTKTLQEIAEEIGYSNQFNFSTAFKRHYQISPNRWRKIHK